MLTYKGKVEIDLMEFADNHDGFMYGVVLLMAKENLMVENGVPEVCINRYTIDYIKSMTLDKTINIMDDIHHRFIIDNKPTIIEINGVTEQDLNSNYNLLRMVEMSSLAIWEDNIVKDRKDINMYKIYKEQQETVKK